MVINYFNVVSITIFKPEANVPLLINSNAVLSFSVTLEHFKVMCRWDSQVFNVLRGINSVQSHLNVVKDTDIYCDFVKLKPTFIK